jgi:hypothetical protein
MAKISTYPILSTPTVNDILIGTDVDDLNITKNFSIGSIIGIVGNQFVPYTGATGNVNLGAFSITADSFIVAGGLATQFVKADGSLDSTVYVPASRTLTINSVTFDLSANRSWDLNTINSLTTTGTSGPATYIGKTLNIPQYQAQGNYITQLSGEATAMGPGNATVTLSNLAVINKVLTGLNITGGTVVDTDSILTAFGKVQNQINGLAGGVTYEGTWNATTNVPFLQSSVGVQGHYYVVNVAGTTNLNGITDWQLGDWAIFNGSVWEKVDNTDAVVSVNGYTGAVVLTFSDVGAPPATRNLTINGVQFDLTADRTWTVGDVRTDQTYANPTWITSLAWTKITGTPTTLAGYGITDGALNTTELTINGVTFNLTANRTWNVGTVTSIATTGPLTGGTITGSGTIGITQSGVASDGYLSSIDWNTFNNKQNALTNPVTGTGTIHTLPMWGGATSLIDSPLSYGSDNFNFQYNSATGGSVTFTNSGLTAYAYTIQMNNFGSPRSTIHSYTDGLIIQSIAGTQVSRMFANGNLILGTGTVETGHKLTISGDLFVNTIINAVTDTDRFIVSDGGIIKYRTGAQLLSDIGAQGSLTLTTTGTSGAATLIGNTLNIPQYTDQFVGTVTSVGLSMPIAFTVSNSPVTSAGTLTVVGAGLASQYVRGDGTLGDFPSGGGGGGSSVSYYLNGSINQGTFAGNTYYEMSKVPVFGAGTDFNIATDGYVAQFITDANDPESLLIPAGNWNFELYFSASSSGGTPSFYVELYKYDGTTFTLIADNSANPELIAFGTIINPYFSPLAVPETVLAITDRLAIRVYVNNSGRTITLHTENSHLCQIITTFTTGLTTLNGLTKQVQYLATGTSGSDFNISSATATHTFNLPTASAVNRGALSAADWAVFNGKQNAITLTTTGTSGVSTLIGSTLNIPNYSTDLSGYVTLATDQTITGLKTILRGGDVLNFKIGTDTIYGLKVAYNQNELVPSGEATWSFVNTFNRNGSGFSVTPLSFFRGVLVTGDRLLSASVNTNLLDYYANNPTGRYPIYAYNTGVQQFASSIIVGETNGVVDAITGAIADLPAGVVANFKGRVIGSNAVNNNEFATLGQVTSTSRAAISLTTTGTSGPATYSSVTGVLNIPEYQGGVTSFNTRTGAVTLTSLDVTTALGYTPVTDARTLSINGVTYDLTANRSWTVGVNPSAREIQTYIATASQTTFTVTGGYTVGLVDVFINGVRLTSSDYTATDGTTVVLTVGTMAGNIVDIIKYTSGITNPIAGTLATGQVAFGTAANTIGGSNNLFWNNGSGYLGINKSIPQVNLDVAGSTGIYQRDSSGGSIVLDDSDTADASTPMSYIRNTSGALQFGRANRNASTGITTNSVESWRIASTGILQSNGAQTIRTSTGNLTLATAGGNGNIVLSPNGTGNVGIGTASPVSGQGTPLTLESSTGFVGITFRGTGSSDHIWQLYSSNSGGVKFFGIFDRTNNAYRLIANSLGNILIGTTTDAGFRLDVNGTGRFSGNLGVGITSFPSWASGTENVLQVKSASIYEYGGYETGFSVNAYYNLGWKYIGTNVASQIVVSSGAFTFNRSVSGTAGNAISWIPSMTINNSGNVGIGTTTPDVTGFGWRTLTIRGGTTSGEAGVIELQSPSTTGAANLGIIAFMDGSNRNAQIYAQRDSSTTTGNILFATNGGSGLLERMRITSGGNVVMGNNAGSAWSTSSTRTTLEIYGGAYPMALHNSTSVGNSISYNTYWDGTNWRYVQTGASVIYIQDSEGHKFLHNGAGSAGASFTPTERMRITSGGNVLIGTTTDGGRKLEVQTGSTNAALWVQTGGTTSAYTIADFRTGTNLPALQILGNGNVNIAGYLTVNSYANMIGGTFSVPASTTKTVTVSFNSGNIHAFLGFSSESGGTTGSGSKSIFLGGTTNDGSGHTPTVISTFSYGDQVVGVGTTNTTSGFTFTIQNNKGSAVNWSWSAFGSFSTLTVT